MYSHLSQLSIINVYNYKYILIILEVCCRLSSQWRIMDCFLRFISNEKKGIVVGSISARINLVPLLRHSSSTMRNTIEVQSLYSNALRPILVFTVTLVLTLYFLLFTLYFLLFTLYSLLHTSYFLLITDYSLYTSFTSHHYQCYH